MRERKRTKENRSITKEPFREKNSFLSFWAWSRVTQMKSHAVSIKEKEQNEEQNLLRNTQRSNGGVWDAKFSENSWVASKTESCKQSNVQQQREPRKNHLHVFSKVCAQKSPNVIWKNDCGLRIWCVMIYKCEGFFWVFTKSKREREEKKRLFGYLHL